MFGSRASSESGSKLLARSQIKPSINSILLDHFSKRFLPQNGKSLVEISFPYSCDCFHFLNYVLALCILPKEINGISSIGFNSHCILMDCGGQFSTHRFTSFVKTLLKNEFWIDITSGTLNGLMNEIMTRIHVIRIFTDNELLLGLYSSREILKQFPVSCLIVFPINAFSNLERIHCNSQKVLTTHYTILFGLLLRIISDFQLLCMVFRRSYSSNRLNENFYSEASESMKCNSSNNLLSKYTTHRINLMDCFSTYVSYVIQGSDTKLIKDTRL